MGDDDQKYLALFATMRDAFDGNPSAAAALLGASDDSDPVVRSTSLTARALIAVADADAHVDAIQLTQEALDVATDDTSVALGIPAAVHAVRATALLELSYDEAMSEHVVARELVDRNPGNRVAAGYTQFALNSITVFCVRVGLFDDAVAAADAALLHERVWRGDPPEGHEGASALLNVMLMTAQAGFGPLSENMDVRQADLARAGELAWEALFDPRITGPRMFVVLTVIAAVEAFTGSAQKVWDYLPDGPSWWSTARMPATALWVIAAARSAERVLLAPPDELPEMVVLGVLSQARSGYRRLSEPVDGRQHRHSFLTLAATSQMLAAEHAATRRGYPDRVRRVATHRDRLHERLVATSRRAFAAALSGHERSQQMASRHAKLQVTSRVDPITSTGNRQHLEQVLDTWPARAGVGVVIIDIDAFKAINDQYGHLVGDEVLGQVGRLLATCVRSSDGLFRYGGDEFVAVLDSDDAGATSTCADRMRAAVSAYPWDDLRAGLRVTVTTGAGVGTDGPRLVLERADTELLARKRRRRQES